MSIASEVTALGTNLQAAKDAVVAKGGTVGDTGLAGLANEIGTISGGGGEEYVAPYGNIEYCAYSTQWEFYPNCSPGEITVTIEQQEVFDAFIRDNQPDQDFVTIEYQGSRWMYYSFVAGQMYQWNDEYEVLQNTGLKILWEDGGEQRQYAQVSGSKQTTVDTSTPAGVMYINSSADFNSLGNSGGTTTFNGVPVKAFTKVILGASVQTIPNYFLSYASNLSEVDMSRATNLTTIGTYFLSDDNALNCDFNIPSGVTAIKDCFLYRCRGFNGNVTLPDTLTTIGNYFIGATNLNGSLNKPITIPNSVTSIGTYFLAGQIQFNSEVSLPSGYLTIGKGFMYCCYVYNKPIRFSSNTIVAPGYLMYECRKFTQLKADGALSSDTSNINYAFATSNANNDIYRIGVTVTGGRRATWISTLPNRTSNPYRKLINGGA